MLTPASPPSPAVPDAKNDAPVAGDALYYRKLPDATLESAIMELETYLKEKDVRNWTFQRGVSSLRARGATSEQITLLRQEFNAQQLALSSALASATAEKHQRQKERDLQLWQHARKADNALTLHELLEDRRIPDALDIKALICFTPQGEALDFSASSAWRQGKDKRYQMLPLKTLGDLRKEYGGYRLDSSAAPHSRESGSVSRITVRRILVPKSEVMREVLRTPLQQGTWDTYNAED